MQTPRPISTSLKRTPIKATTTTTSPAQTTRKMPESTKNAEVVDLEQEIKSMHLTWHRPERRLKHGTSTFSRRAQDNASQSSASSASRWEVGQVADLASRLADNLYLVITFLFDVQEGAGKEVMF